MPMPKANWWINPPCSMKYAVTLVSVGGRLWAAANPGREATFHLAPPAGIGAQA